MGEEKEEDLSESPGGFDGSRFENLERRNPILLPCTLSFICSGQILAGTREEEGDVLFPDAHGHFIFN
jgi:hypothetical protein